MTISRRLSWDGKPLAVNGGVAELPDEALHNSAVVGSSNAPVVDEEPAVPDPGEPIGVAEQPDTEPDAGPGEEKPKRSPRRRGPTDDPDPPSRAAPAAED